MRRRRQRRVVVASFFALVAIGFWTPAWMDPSATGFGDWQFFHNQWEAGRVAVTRWGEWPLWNPFNCAGMTLWGNPQNQTLSPFFWLSPFLGSTIAIKIHLIGHAFVGMVGMYAFARSEVRLAGVPSALAAVAWGCSGTFAWDGGGGHSTFLGFWLLPLLLLSFRRAAEDPRWASITAGIFAMMLIDGATYVPAYAVLVLAFDGIVRFSRWRSRRGLVRSALIAGPLALMLGAVRAYPSLLTMQRNPRRDLSRVPDSVNLSELLEMLTTREHEWRWEGHEFVWGEYTAFIGFTVVALGVVGLLLSLGRGRAWLSFGAILFGAYTLGNAGDYAPWTLTQLLPVYDNLRVPARFAVVFLFYFTLCAGVALDAIQKRLSRWKFWRVAVPVLILLGAGTDLFIVNIDSSPNWRGDAIYADSPYGKFFVERGVHHSRSYASLPQRNRGTRYCREAVYVRVPRGMWIGNVPQVRLAGSQGTVHDWDRTANTVWADVEVSEPTVMTINQRWDWDWVSDVGTVAEEAGMLAVHVPAGRHRVVARYAPREIPWLVALMAIGLALAFLNWRLGTAARWASLRRKILRR